MQTCCSASLIIHALSPLSACHIDAQLCVSAQYLTRNLQIPWLAAHVLGQRDLSYLFITEEVKKRDPLTGKEFERTDVEIHLRHRYIRGQKPYFVFESKRLNVSYGTAVRSEAHAYVAEGGMGHLLAGGYESVPNFNGMLAYVMDGQLAKAKDAVEKQLASKSGELQLVGEAKIHSSKLMPAGSPHGETRNVKGAEEFKLFHLFLAV